MKKFSQYLLILGLAIGMIACSDDEDPMSSQDMTIAEIAADTDDLSNLVSALERADLVSVLDGDTDYTVFAPSNAAFERFLTDNGFSEVDDVPEAVLQNILLNHVVSGSVMSNGLSAGYIETNAEESTTGNNLNMYVSTDNGVTLNGISTVTQADIEASNGVIHLVDEVIGLPTVVTFATADPGFSTLTLALTRSDLTTDFVSVLSGEGPFTVFAPTNDAFADLLAELGLSGLADIETATLDAVLKYHVAGDANVLSTMLSDGMEVMTLADDSFTVQLDNGAQLVDSQGRTIDVIVTDVQASNGVVHALNRVLLP